jgi:voltage-dependent potassium channel beta subunit
MQYRRLGQSGLKISAVSLGGWLTFGSQVDEAGVKQVVTAAVEGGVNFIDLADVYAKGEAERVFGKALAGFRRQDLVISSKAFWAMSDNVNDRGLSRKHLFESVEGSLRRLGTDYLDIYFCHRFDEETPVEEVVMAMDDLCRQGKILYWGSSVWTAAQITEAALTARRLGAHPPRVEQPRYNLLDRHIEPEILPTCMAQGIGIVCWSPLGQGLLTGKYNDGMPAGSRAGELEWVRQGITEVSLARVRQLAAVAADLGVPLGQMALAWCLRQDGVSSVITGARTAAQVQENLAAADLTLDAATLERIEAIVEPAPALLKM